MCLAQKNLTLVFLKPDVTCSYSLVKRIKANIEDNFKIKYYLNNYTLTEDLTKEFYKIHENKFFYQRLVKFISSGPIIPMVLQGENVVNDFRKMLGPSNFYKAQTQFPNTLRGLYGTSDVYNVAHASDTAESAIKEIQFFFPGLSESEK